MLSTHNSVSLPDSCVSRFQGIRGAGNPWLANGISLVLILMVIFGGAAEGVQPPRPVVLEAVKFRLFDKEREDVAEVTFEDDQFELRLFNEKLAAYYSVKILAEDLISAVPLGATESEEIQSRRQHLIMLREQARIERRKKAQAQKSARKNLTRSGEINTGPNSKQTSAATLLEPVKSGLDKSGYVELLGEFSVRTTELTARNVQIIDSSQSSLDRLAAWEEASDSKTRVYHALKRETHSILEDAESLRNTLASRKKEIQRTVEQAGQGHLKTRDLPEVVDRIRQRLARCEEKVGALESLTLACADGMVSLGDPIVHSGSDTQEAETTVARPVRASSAPRRKGEFATGNDSVVHASYRNAPAKAESTPTVEAGTQELSPVDNAIDADTEESVGGVTIESNQPDDSDEGLQQDNQSTNRVRDLIIGTIIGAILVLLLSRVIKSLP